MGLIRLLVDDPSRNVVLQFAPSKRAFEREKAVPRAHTSPEVELAKALIDGELHRRPRSQIVCPYPGIFSA